MTVYTNDELAAIEAEARSLFEADRSSQYEADWPNLAPYKRRDWIDRAVRLRDDENVLRLGGMTLVNRHGDVDIYTAGHPETVAVRIQRADMAEVARFLDLAYERERDRQREAAAEESP